MGGGEGTSAHLKMLFDLHQDPLAGLAILALAGLAQVHAELRDLLRAEAGTAALKLVHHLVHGVEVRRPRRRQLRVQLLQLRAAVFEVELNHLNASDQRSGDRRH